MSISYVRYLPGSPKSIGWRLNPTNTVIVNVLDAQTAPNLKEGQSLARATLAKLVAAEVIGQERPYELPPVPVKVGELEHPEKLLSAYILKWPDFYEV